MPTYHIIAFREKKIKLFTVTVAPTPHTRLVQQQNEKSLGIINDIEMFIRVVSDVEVQKSLVPPSLLKWDATPL